MILTALAQYRPAESKPSGYESKPVGFELAIDADGGGAVLTPLHREVEASGSPKKPRVVGQPCLVPTMTRSNNPPPLLGTDNAAFVLGMVKDDAAATLPPAARIATADLDAAPARAALAKREAFVALLQEYGDETGDSDVPIIASWYRNGCPGLIDALMALSDFAQKAIATELIALRLEGSPRIHDKPEAQRFWAARALAAKGTGRQEHCLVCGVARTVVDTFPLSIAGRLVPGASASNVSLVSANFPAAQRGATGQGLRSAPVCGDCATRAVQAFNTLASSDSNRWGHASDSNAMIWWERSGETTSAISLFFSRQPAASEVKDFLHTVTRGSTVTPEAPSENDERFYALIYSGNVARLVVRSWIDLPLAHAMGHVADWFANSENASSQPYRSVMALAQSAGPVGRGTQPDRGPEGMTEGLIRTALTGADPPAHALPLALARARAEHHLTGDADERFVKHVRSRAHARASLIRLILNYTLLKENPMTAYLDPERSDPAYLHGRLFAMRENIQYQALGDVNAGVGARFFSRASVNPAAVDGALCRLTQQHLAAMRRKQDKRGLGIVLGRQYDELRAQAGDPPRQMSAEEQGIWMTGYYQQRVHRSSSSAADSASEQGTHDTETNTADDIEGN